MCNYRIGPHSAEIEAEGERLYIAWTQDDESLSWETYLLKHASPAALACMQEIKEAHEYAQKKNVLI